MVSVDISLTPSLPGATLSLSLSLNKRILGDFTGYYVFSEEFASDRRKASRGSVNQNVAGRNKFLLEQAAQQGGAARHDG